MAIYHFKLKSDKNPDGMVVNAINKVSYINREGQYKHIDDTELLKSTSQNLIFANVAIEGFPNEETLLYESPFGWIKYSQQGIRVSYNASPVTIAIAMSVAKYVYGENNSLEISGKPKFIVTTSIAAAELDLPIKFSNNLLDNNRLLIIEKEKDFRNERNGYQENFGNFIRGNIEFFGAENRGLIGGAKFSQSNITGNSLKAITEKGFCLPTLHSGSMVLARRKSDMLLHGNEMRSIHRARRRAYTTMRRCLYGNGCKKEIENAAATIMINIQKHMDHVSAKSHLQYINRETTFKQKGGCLYKDNHLPSWAENSPQKFFEMADLKERDNGERYKELEFALPNELNLSQQREIIDEFLNKYMQNFYFAYAIHDKIGAMSDGERHPHVHLMFSTREIDAIERQNERTPDMFFHRANSKNPIRGGCKKSTLWTDEHRKVYLNYLREDFAKIQNAVLKKYHVPVQVDHRSFKARRMEALATNNQYLADLLDRLPQKYIGLSSSARTSIADINNLKSFRKHIRNYEKTVFIKHFLQSIVDETTIATDFEKNKSSFSELKEKLDLKIMPILLKEATEIEEEINMLTNLRKKTYETIQDAQLEFMDSDERNIWQDFKSIALEKKYWQDFKTGIIKPSNDDEISDYNKLIMEINLHIANKSENMALLLPDVQQIFMRLSSDPLQRKIKQRSAEIIYENKSILKKISMLNSKYADMIKLIQTNIKFAEKSEKTYFINDIIREQKTYLNILYKHLSSQQSVVNEARKKVISYDRAMVIAKNLYTKGQYKRLREAKRTLKKNSSPDNKEQARISAWEQRLNNYCALSGAEEKIKEIIDGVLLKNLAVADLYKQEQNHLSDLNKEISEVKKILHECYKESKFHPNTKYKIFDKTLPTVDKRNISGGIIEDIRTAATSSWKIASAIAGNNKNAQLVARSKHEDIDEWEFLSQAEKDELRNNTDAMTR